VHLVGFYYKNISQRMVLWMSKKFYYILHYMLYKAYVSLLEVLLRCNHVQFIIQTNECTTYILIIFYIS